MNQYDSYGDNPDDFAEADEEEEMGVDVMDYDGLTEDPEGPLAGGWR